METTNPNEQHSPAQPTILHMIAHTPQLWWHIAKKKPLVGIATVFVLVVFILLTIVAILPKRAKTPDLSQPTPTLQPTPSFQPQQISITGQTDAFIKLENTLDQITSEIDTLDLLESRLTIPVLDVSLVPLE